MRRVLGKLTVLDWVVVTIVLILLILKTVLLKSIYPQIFPSYFVFYIVAFFVFIFFLMIDFDIYIIFSKHLYILSIALLIITLVLGQATRGVVRWIPLGNYSIQPSEIVRPFLYLYFSVYFLKNIRNKITINNLFVSLLIIVLPIILIIMQPSLGVAMLTLIGFIAGIFSSELSKKKLLIIFLLIISSVPFLWFILKPYQRERINAFIDPNSDPLGSGYNSIQSTITVGSGGLSGRGLGKGVQTQLEFLPEKQTDFIFASVAEEFGFTGAFTVIIAYIVLFWILSGIVGDCANPYARAFVVSVISVFIAETFIHIGMNMGMLPVTGVPLPFLSAGGSSLIGSTILLSMVIGARKKKSSL